MNLTSYSKFYYGIYVGEQNYLDFHDGTSLRSISIKSGGYSLTGLGIEIAKAMNAASTLTFYCTFDRSSRLLSINGSGIFSLLFASGPNSALSLKDVIGFQGVDYSGAALYSGLNAVGKEYKPQFYLQNYVDADFNKTPISAVVNRSTSGRVFEVVKFGSDNIFRFEIKYTTNLKIEGGSPIKQNLTGVEDLKDFMEYSSEKWPLEFMKDEEDPDDFSQVILESTPSNQDGVGYEISPDYSAQLPEFYTLGGELVFRRI
jgi:hypothetical protein